MASLLSCSNLYKLLTDFGVRLIHREKGYNIPVQNTKSIHSPFFEMNYIQSLVNSVESNGQVRGNGSFVKGDSSVVVNVFE